MTGRMAALALLAALAAAPGAVREAGAQEAGPPPRSGLGKQVYQRANCVGCHKWHGGGGGGYGGSALSLRTSQLTREQIAEVVNCGRPSTGMPYHQRGAYDAGACHGLSWQDLGKDAPPQGAVLLRPAEVEAVVDYVAAGVLGRGEPTYAECAAFFGEGARVCAPLRTAEAPAARPE